MTPEQIELEVAKAEARAGALAEAAALAAIYERQGANVAFLQRVLAGRAEKAYEQADALRHHPARDLAPVA